jgi:hypothetical protein
VTIPCVYKALRKTGRRTGRSKLRVGSPDPDYTVKRKSVKDMQNLLFLGSRGVCPEKSTFESDRAIMALYAR